MGAEVVRREEPDIVVPGTHGRPKPGIMQPQSSCDGIYKYSGKQLSWLPVSAVRTHA